LTTNKIIEWEVTPDIPHVRLRIIADTGNGQRGYTFYIDPSFGLSLASTMIPVATRLAEELEEMEKEAEELRSELAAEIESENESDPNG
jgi:hypothetical protein